MRKKKPFHADPYQYHQELELTVESITNLGMGICRDNGWVIMVPFVIPGETVKLRIFKNNKNYSEADLIQVIHPREERIAPKCELFGECGGCQYQHVHYDTQKQWKSEQVKELFERLAGIMITPEPTVGTANIYGYRSKLTPHYKKPRDGKYDKIGFLKMGKRQEIIDVPHCPIATDPINETLVKAREKLQLEANERHNNGKKRKGGTLLLRDTGEQVITNPKDTGQEKVGDTVFQFRAGEFFQNNPFILPELVQYTLKETQQEQNLPYLIDAYCGVGLFSISARDKFQECLGIEISEYSIEWAKKNAALNHADNCKFLLGSAEEIFEQVPYPAHKTSMIIDPPRKGCDTIFLTQLVEYKPQRLVYVSCDPATQARDTKFLLEHGYQLERVQPFDLFPQTRHVESVATFSLIET